MSSVTQSTASSQAPSSTVEFSLGPTLSSVPAPETNHRGLPQTALISIFAVAALLAAVGIMLWRFSRLSRNRRSWLAFVTCSFVRRRRQDANANVNDDDQSQSHSRVSLSRRPSSIWSADTVDVLQSSHMISSTPGITVTPAFLYASNLGPFPTVYDPSARTTRAPDVGAGGRRLGTRDSDQIDGAGEKDELPAYERANHGLPDYGEHGNTPRGDDRSVQGP